VSFVRFFELAAALGANAKSVGSLQRLSMPFVFPHFDMRLVDASRRAQNLNNHRDSFCVGKADVINLLQ